MKTLYLNVLSTDQTTKRKQQNETLDNFLIVSILLCRAGRKSRQIGHGRLYKCRIPDSKSSGGISGILWYILQYYEG